MSKILTRPGVGAVLVFIISFVIYLQTMAPAVPFIDGGELSTVCATLGIAHPTGYPIFCLIGYIFAHLPIAEHVVLRLNIMAAFFVALGSGGMVFLVSELYLYWFNRKRVKPPVQKGKKGALKQTDVAPVVDEARRMESVAAGIFAGLAMAFSATWWDTSSSIEVYPLHCFMLPIVLTFFFRMLRLEKEKFGKESILFALTLGLSFSNHMTTVLLAPACLYMYFAANGFKRPSFVHIGKLAIPFFVGLLPYLYLPLRASQYPLMDWGHPTDLHSFWKHFTGGQYSIMMFTKDAPSKNWPYFWAKYPEEFTFLGIILVVCGLYALLKSSGRGKAHLLPFVVLFFFGCLLWSMNYDIVDIDTYFLTAYVASGITITFGAVWLLGLIRKKINADLSTLLIGATLVFSMIQIFQHYTEVDQSGNYFVEDYTKNMLNSLPKDAIIFNSISDASSAWDFWGSGAFYFQHIEHIRPDIFVIDGAMMRDRPWYYSYLRQRFPEVLKRAEPELDAFMHELVLFDRGLPYDTLHMGELYRNFTEALISRNLDRPIFLSPDGILRRDPLFAPSFRPFPSGLSYRLLQQDSVFEVPLPTIQWNDKNYRSRSYYTDNARFLQALPLADRAQFLATHGRIEEAKKFLDLALRFEPDMSFDIEKLHGRDKDVAIQTNENFSRYEALRKRLGK
ncbi:MAG: DUF2723 domain-containing protein [Bacteroidota bacterium]|nr:DUF2723 domain-containing protein [Bacteroidota bacterium]MDP4229741.1 DUF2723 domain-containing protein [Bacteroidota bacterium]MDP4235879.1 DUF2723 domain-containing protein [Bacteroidota bacterium]